MYDYRKIYKKMRKKTRELVFMVVDKTLFTQLDRYNRMPPNEDITINYRMAVDAGTSIIRRGHQRKCILERSLTWEYYLKERERILNCLSDQDFLNMYKK